MLALTNLKCLHLNNPMGIELQPYFSWVLKSDEEGTMQKAYKIKVSDEGGRTCWDTGWMESEQSTYVTYVGENLQSRTKYIWEVGVKDNHGNEAEGTAHFETAFLEKGDWKAKWVKDPFDKVERLAHFKEQPPAVLFRQSIRIEKKMVKARLYATCHGTYRLTINGMRPDDREFAPDYTVYRDYLCYQAYDVTSLLCQGENVIGMHVGDGWYHGFMTKAQDANYDPAYAILTQLEVKYEDGTEEVFSSDESVKVAESPIRHSDLFAGELYDANQMPYGWDEPGFDDKDWANTILADFGYERLHAQYGQPVRPIIVLPVKEILTSPKGERILDFGQVIAGRVRLNVNVEKGTKVTVIHTESLDAKGNFFDNNPTADQRVEFISDGIAQEYEPYFTFMGFRYVMIDGIEELKAEDVSVVVLSSEKENVGSFSCSDAEVTRLYENTRWSQYANMLSIPTDCPQREKAGWTGDIQVYTKTALLNEDITPFLSRWLENLELEQKENGSVPFLAPLGGAIIGQYQMYEQQYQTPNAVAPAGWADAIVLVPYYMYLITGNTVVLRRHYEAMKRWCDFVLKTAKENRPQESTLPDEVEQYLWNTGMHYGEHLIPSYSKDGYGPQTYEAIRISTKYVAPIYEYYSLKCLTEIAGILGEGEDAAYYGDMTEKVADVFGKGVIDEAGNMPADLMGAYAMPIYYGLVPKQWEEKFAAGLVRKIEENDGCLDTGFLGTPILQDALCKIGRIDLAYNLLFNTQAPSWLYEVRHGATTIWESWFALDEDGAPFVSEMGGMVFSMSLNHYAFGCVDDWMFRHINGINYEEPGFKKIRIEPKLDERLTWAKRTFTSEYGDIVSEWEKKENQFILHVEIPCNTTATVVLPNGEHFEKGNGRYQFQVTL